MSDITEDFTRLPIPRGSAASAPSAEHSQLDEDELELLTDSLRAEHRESAGTPDSAMPAVYTVLSDPVAKISTGKPPVERMTAEIQRLTDLPESWFVPAPNERGGYQYRTQTLIFGKYVETLLDGCAGSNNVTEEMIVGMINIAYREGIKSTDPPGTPLFSWSVGLCRRLLPGLPQGIPYRLPAESSCESTSSRVVA